MKKRSTLFSESLEKGKRLKRAEDAAIIDLTGDDSSDDDDDSVIFAQEVKVVPSAVIKKKHTQTHTRTPLIQNPSRALKATHHASDSIDVDTDINEEGFKLHPKQQKVIDLVDQGVNIFLTGPGGTGKSVVLRKIIEKLSNKYGSASDKWAAVASTGISAVPIGGQTLHRFAGCGVPTVKDDFEKCWGKRDQWRALKVLIIEEISMLSGEFIDNLSDVVTRIRDDNNDHDEGKDGPFGGIQLVFCGDFLQLPPISKTSRQIQAMSYQGGYGTSPIQGNRGFAFQSSAWKEANLQVVELDHVFRQDDTTFQSVLAEIRKGVVSAGTKKFLQRCNRPLPNTSSGIKPTKLYAKNRDVTAENLQELRKISGPEHQFQARDSIDVDHGDDHDDDYPRYHNSRDARNELWRNKFFNDCIAEKELRLKVNAQVMLIKNEQGRSDRGEHFKPLSNGSRGVVIGFTKKGKKSKKYGYDDDDNDDDIEILGGDDNDELSVDSLEGAYEDDDDSGSDDDCAYPIVRFKCGRTKAIRFESFTSKVPGVGECKREAIPLKLAWAVTIHKSQGMTLDYVKVDVSGVFTQAQTYVALSRATDEKGLQLIGFSASKVKADKRAVAFYENPNANFPIWSETWN